MGNPNMSKAASKRPAHEVEKERSNFRFNGQQMLLTYPVWLDLEEAHKFIEAIFSQPLKHFKGVHEIGATGHRHTHIVLQWKKKVEFRKADKLDFGPHHPNIKKLPNQQAVDDADDYLEKDIPEGEGHLFEWDAEPTGEEAVESTSNLHHDIVNAETLWDAIEAAGIKIRSVNDVKLLRDDKKRRLGIGTCFASGSWKRPITAGHWRVLVITGGTGLGKTQWAIAHYLRALIVSHMDDLKQFDPRIHDGIIFDDMSFKHLHREFLIHLTDWDLDRSIHCRHSCAFIPRHTRKIFTTNLPFEELFPEDPSGAIRRRITHIIEVDSPLFDEHVVVGDDVNFTAPAKVDYDTDASVDSLD